MRKDTTIGTITIILALLGVFTFINTQYNLKIDITNNNTVFYTGDNTTGNNTWTIGGTETWKLINDSKELKPDKISISNKIKDNISILTRTSTYGKTKIVDTYTFDGNAKRIEDFPLRHDVSITNGKGMTYYYIVSINNQDRMRLTIDKSYDSYVPYTASYNLKSNSVKLSFNLFDPLPTNKYILNDTFETAVTGYNTGNNWTYANGYVTINTTIVHSGTQSLQSIDASGGYIYTGINLTQPNVTCSVWMASNYAVNTSATNTFQGMFTQLDGEPNIGRVMAFNTTTYWTGNYSTASSYKYSNLTIVANTWYRLLIYHVGNGSVLLYFNNTLITTVGGKANMTRLWIGKSSGNAGTNQVTYYDDLLCWKGPLADEPASVITPNINIVQNYNISIWSFNITNVGWNEFNNVSTSGRAYYSYYINQSNVIPVYSSCSYNLTILSSPINITLLQNISNNFTLRLTLNNTIYNYTSNITKSIVIGNGTYCMNISIDFYNNTVRWYNNLSTLNNTFVKTLNDVNLTVI